MSEDGKIGTLVFAAGWVATMLGMCWWSDRWSKRDKKQQQR